MDFFKKLTIKLSEINFHREKPSFNVTKEIETILLQVAQCNDVLNNLSKNQRNDFDLDILKKSVKMITESSTKILAEQLGGKWQEDDVSAIMRDGAKGLKHLFDIYK